MPFEPGHKKMGGRKSGSQNKTTADIKTRLAALVDEQFDAIQDDFDQLEPKDRVAAYMKLLEYVIPKMRESKIDLNTKLESLSDEQLNKLIDNIITS